MNNIRLNVGISLVTVLLIVFMFPSGESLESEITVGSIWIKDDLIASTTFEVLKDPELYKQETEKALSKVLPVFVKKNENIKISLDSLENYNNFILNELDFNVLNNPDKPRNTTFLSDEAYKAFLSLRKNENQLSGNVDFPLQKIFILAKNVLSNSIYRRGVIDKRYTDIENDSITIRDGKFEKFYQVNLFYDKEAATGVITEEVLRNIPNNIRLQGAVINYVSQFIVPNIVYNDEFTLNAKKAAKDKVSRNIGIVNENERIIAKHNRVTPEIKQKIDSYKAAIGEQKGIWNLIGQEIGKFLHIFLIILIFAAYIFLFRKRILNDTSKVLLISLIIVFITFISFLISQIDVNVPLYHLSLIPVAAILLTILFDSRLGFYITIVLALITAGIRGNDYIFALINIVAGAAAAYTVRDKKKRNQIFQSFIYILIAYIVGTVSFGLERFSSFNTILLEIAFTSVNALISPVLAFGLLIFFEKTFKITTDISLLELTDTELPLLRELSVKSPGTNSHSQQIGTIVEAAANEIDANPTLAKVGALYHDIGKTLKPEAFIENQGKYSIHDKLEPIESAKIIIDHVEKGIKLAEKYKLPREIIDFIPAHHGTMIVQYFYQKAIEKYGKEKVNINDYRYKGPKPKNKETALVMLADAIESSCRAVEDPSEEKFKNLINNLIDARIKDGQLDESPITFNDIRKIKEVFLKTILSIYHARIRYPNQGEMEEENIPDKDE